MKPFPLTSSLTPLLCGAITDAVILLFQGSTLGVAAAEAVRFMGTACLFKAAIDPVAHRLFDWSGR